MKKGEKAEHLVRKYLQMCILMKKKVRNVAPFGFKWLILHEK